MKLYCKPMIETELFAVEDAILASGFQVNEGPNLMTNHQEVM